MELARFGLCASAAMAWLCSSQAGFAQDSAAADADQSTASSLSDIVVTARRRAESITDVPIAVTVLGGDSLKSRGIERVDDLSRATPSLNTRPTAGRRSDSQYEIRGLTTTESLITQDPAVGIYVNEVYRARATGTNQSFYDIENVQVLYGPQGTLFGRNSAAGAVLINTKRPTDSLGGEIQAGLGNLDRYETTGILNVPLGDTLAIRVAGQRVKRDGYATNVTTGRKLGNINSWSGRGSILWRPAPGIENLTVASYYKADETSSVVVLSGFRPCPSTVATAPAASCSGNRAQLGSATPTIRNELANFVNNVRPGLGDYQTGLNATFRDFSADDRTTSTGRYVSDPFENARNFSLSNTTTFDLNDDITLKNIFGYNFNSLKASSDLDGTPLTLIDTYFHTNNRQITNELQLQGDMGRFNWVVGAMYFREKGLDVQNSIQLTTVDTRQRVIGVNTSYAGFAQGTFKLLDNLSITAGGRYTRDKRDAQYLNPRVMSLLTGSNNCSLSPLVDPDGDCYVRQKASFGQASYTLSVDYKPTRDTLIYVAHRYGYRSGGLQARVSPTAFGPVPPFRPETVKDVEVGFKGNVELGGEASLRMSIALYKAWYQDIQRSASIPTGLLPPNPVSTSAIVNAGRAKTKGLDGDAALTLVRGFTISAFFGYFTGSYSNFPALSGTTPIVRKAPFVAAKYTAGGTVSLTPLDDEAHGRVTWLTSLGYRSHYSAGDSLPFVEPESRVPAQAQLSSSLDWDGIGGSNFSAQLWMRNVLKERYNLGTVGLATAFGLVPGVLAEPRTYGLTLKYRFGD